MTRMVAGGLPDYKLVGQGEFGPSPCNENRGRILINRDHSVARKHIAGWPKRR